MKYLVQLLAVAITVLSYNARAQSFPGAAGPIPDNGPVTAFPIQVTGLAITSLDTTFGLETICLSISHSYDADLQIKLQSPDGTIIELSLSNGGSGNNYTGTCFNDNSSNMISNGFAPFNGSWRPQQPLYVLNNGQNPNGTWNLLIQDNFSTDAGSLLSSQLTFGSNPAIPFPFSSSNLPIIKINTLNQSIQDDPKIHCRMQVIDNGAGIRNYYTDTVYAYDGWIGIEVRGSSSQMFPKKSFGVELRDSLENDTSVSLLGMPPESDWVFNANYTDKSFLRNTLAYDLYGKMGSYSVRTRFAEVFINTIYSGIYVICEKIKRDSNRVDIAKLTPLDNAWPDVSGGYIIKVDKTTGSGGGQGFTSLYPPTSGGTLPTILFDYPKSSDITIQQSAYIASYMDSFETALHGPSFADSIIGYRKFADMNSFIDFMLLNEVTKCVDSYRISAYLYKEKINSGGKLFAGPVWDFDIAWGNADYYNGQYTTGWAYITNNGNGSDPFQVPFWWSRLMQDVNFKNAMRCRWNDLRNGAFATATIHAWIDSVAAVLNESQQRNFTMWPILGVYVWPNPSPIPQTYADEILDLKTWITSRLAYMDLSLPGTCTTTGNEELQVANNVIAFPNPAHDRFTLFADGNAIRSILITDAAGRKTEEQEFSARIYELTVNTSAYQPGIYMVRVQHEKGMQVLKMIIQ